MKSSSRLSVVRQKNTNELVPITFIELPSNSRSSLRDDKTLRLVELIPRNSIRLIYPSQIKSRENLFNHTSHRRKQSASIKKRSFNPLAYCMAYCTTIIIGTTIGGWIGGLFEFLFSSHNGCTNVYNGDLHCENKYASTNISTYCMNIFPTKSLSINSPYMCLCRFRNQSNGKYRHCDFLHAKIR